MNHIRIKSYKNIAIYENNRIFCNKTKALSMYHMLQRQTYKHHISEINKNNKFKILTK